MVMSIEVIVQLQIQSLLQMHSLISPEVTRASTVLYSDYNHHLFHQDLLNLNAHPFLKILLRHRQIFH